MMQQPINELIKAELFYTNKQDKTKLNWFCYEIALCFQSALKHKLRDKLKGYQISEADIADFCVHVAKEMKQIILQKLAGEIDDVYFSHQMVEPYFPQFNNRLINRTLKVIQKAWEEQLDFCINCPTRCISEKDEYCTMFDD